MKIINLLPKEKQKELGYKRLFGALVVLVWVTAASFLLVVLVQMGEKVYFQGQRSFLESAIEDLKAQAGKEENAAIKAQVKQANDLVADYRSLTSQIPKFSKVVRAFVPLVPKGVNITSMKIDSARKSIDINGFGPTRDLVIDLYDNIAAESELFPNIDYPLENVARPTDINFHFSFNINPELLK
ncbi:MAG: hypothetical protein UZ12_BCD005000602 [Bacteroidetes bacterium OLB12]|nr:MAG: hypothetical protein UZ12_BCD005000602 [Bacteroidetes bacterium OLB12]